MKTKGRDFLLIIIGTMLMALATNMVFEPMNMVTGGISGIAIVIKRITTSWVKDGIPLWISNAVINIPLFILASIMKGTHFIKKTLYATVSFTVALYIIPSYPVIYGDYLLAAVFGGIVMGVGLGLVFMAGTSTGGTDLFGIVLHSFFRHYSVARLLFGIDASIVLIGALTFGAKTALYAVIAVYLTSKVMDSILEGIKFGKLAFIISDHYKQIANEVMEDMKRGVTSISITGMYSNDKKKMLLCVVSPKEIIKLMDIVERIDPVAFLIVSDVREVMGEGFIEYRQ